MKISRMNRGSWGKIVAFFDLETSDGFNIKGFKLVQGENGLFVGFPSQEKDGEYYDTVWADKEVKESVNELAKREHENPSEIQQELEPASDEEIPF